MNKKAKLNQFSPVDHSKTYKTFNLRNIPHIFRLRKHIRILNKYNTRKVFKSYADYGCSNGYVTDIISKEINSFKTVGYDYSLNLDIARKRYHDIEFRFYDLNIKNIPEEKYDLVTCFETLEHVGCIDLAINNLIDSINETGIIIISVPIETGLIGLIKYAMKRIIYKDRYVLKQPEINYIKSLILNLDISTFRDSEATHYGPHLGFDFRIIDDYLNRIYDISFKSFNSFTTRYYIINKK